MDDQFKHDFGSAAAAPSAAAEPSPPVYTASRLKNVVSANMASVRAGALTPTEAENAIIRALDDFDRRREAAAAVRDAEVTTNAEGRVAADPAATSARAARLVAPKTGSQRARLLEYIVTAPSGATDFEAARDLRLLPNAVRPRRGELIGGGFVVDSGETRQHRGSLWTVWTATQDGHDWYLRQAGAA